MRAKKEVLRKTGIKRKMIVSAKKIKLENIMRKEETEN